MRQALGVLLAGLAALVALVLSAGLPTGAAAREVAPSAASGALQATVGPQPLPYGRSAVLTGTLTDAAGAPLAGEPVVAEARTAAGTWVLVAGPGTTDAAGTVALTVAPTTTSVVRLRHDHPEGVSSAEVTVVVQAVLSASPERAGVRAGRPLRVRGTLAPVPDGARVRLERRGSGRWRLAETVPVAADGTWSATVRETAAGWARYRILRRGAAGVQGTVVVLPAVDVFRVHRYSVTTRGRVRADLERLRAVVAETLADPRGWRRAHHRFREVARGGDFTVVLSQAALLPAYSAECSVTYSCRVGRFVILNDTRWRRGSPFFPGDLATYRRMLVNHETGHWLGLGHAYCAGRGRSAPVMQQQSKGLQGCQVNPWPLRWEITRSMRRS